MIDGEILFRSCGIALVGLSPLGDFGGSPRRLKTSTEGVLASYSFSEAASESAEGDAKVA